MFTGAAAYVRVPSGFALSWSLQPWRVNSNLRNEAEDEVLIPRFVRHSSIKSRMGVPNKKSMTTTRMAPSVRETGLMEKKDLSNLIVYFPSLSWKSHTIVLTLTRAPALSVVGSLTAVTGKRCL